MARRVLSKDGKVVARMGWRRAGLTDLRFRDRRKPFGTRPADAGVPQLRSKPARFTAQGWLRGGSLSVCVKSRKTEAITDFVEAGTADLHDTLFRNISGNLYLIHYDLPTTNTTNDPGLTLRCGRPPDWNAGVS